MRQKTKEEEYEELLEDYASAREYYNDMHNRADYVNWSPKAEKEAYDEYWAIKKKIIDIMVGEENED